MFERFTDRARRVIVLAQEEARELRHNYIGTEHILLGLCREGEGVAALALQSLNIALPDVRKHVEAAVLAGESETRGNIPFTPRGKKVQELALREALQLGHKYIGTEHLLLALIREGSGVAAEVLVRDFGLDLNKLRQHVRTVLADLYGTQAASEEAPAPARAIQVTVNETDLAALLATYDALVAAGWTPPKS